MVAEKVLPKSWMKNKIVQLAYKGKINRQKVMEHIAKKNLPKGIIEKYAALKRFKEDPNGFLKSKSYTEKAGPCLTLPIFQSEHRFIILWIIHCDLKIPTTLVTAGYHLGTGMICC